MLPTIAGAAPPADVAKVVLLTLPLWPMPGYCSRPTLLGGGGVLTIGVAALAVADQATMVVAGSPTDHAGIPFPADPAGMPFPADLAGIPFPADLAGILFPAFLLGYCSRPTLLGCRSRPTLLGRSPLV